MMWLLLLASLHLDILGQMDTSLKPWEMRAEWFDDKNKSAGEANQQDMSPTGGCIETTANVCPQLSVVLETLASHLH